ncbi:MAG: LysE family translocator [Pseudomonadota bacterium]
MTNELWLGLVLFTGVASITPGPNNLMLMASGANFGFRRTVPHILGIEVGFTLMVVLVGAGISELFERFPTSFTVLRVASGAYLAYLAFKLATSRSFSSDRKSDPKPLTFMQAALFQWVNPKAWAMGLTAVSVYAPTPGMAAIILIAGTFLLVGIPSTLTWTMLGLQMRKVLTNEIYLARFNVVMALLLVASLLPLLVS